MLGWSSAIYGGIKPMITTPRQFQNLITAPRLRRSVRYRLFFFSFALVLLFVCVPPTCFAQNPPTGIHGGRPTIIPMNSFSQRKNMSDFSKADLADRVRSTNAGLLPSDEIRLIVQFRNEPLGAVVSLRTAGSRQKLARLREALSAIRTEQQRFETDVEQIDAAFHSKPAGTPTAPHTRIHRRFTIALNAMAITTARWIGEEIQKLPYVSRVSEDGLVQTCDDTSNAVIGAPDFWSAYGEGGEGIDIGFLDSGIDYLHEALGGAPFPNSKVVGGYDFVNDDADPMDDNGHGTHVAGIAAGNGPPPTNLRGVAYGARIWAFKVMDAQGVGYFSTLLAGIEKALDPDDNPETPTPIRVLNLSIGSTPTFLFIRPEDPISQAVDNAVRAGVVCVVAAGNDGPVQQSISSPGGARNALTVGASDNQDHIAPFSSLGPTNNTYSFKPDLVAPGVRTYSAQLGGGYVNHSGTSMATPHVTGAAALLIQRHPTWSPAEIKAALMESAHDIGRDIWTQGNGRVSIADAARRNVVITPASLHFGIDDLNAPAVWSSSATLTFRNDTTAVQQFSFTAEGVPPGVQVLFAPSTLTVPDHGIDSVNVSIVVDPSVPYAAVTAYHGTLLVHDNSTITRVPFGFVKSRMMRLIADETPKWFLVFDTVHSQAGMWEYPWPIKDDTLNILFPLLGSSPMLPEFNLFGGYSDGVTRIVKEHLPTDGVTVVRVNQADAKNRVSVRCLDRDGTQITSGWDQAFAYITWNGGMWGLDPYCPDWILPCPPFTEPLELKFPDFGPNVQLFLKFRVLTAQGVMYELPFALLNGLSSSVVLQNDPGQLHHITYTYSVPDSGNPIYIDPVMEYEGGEVSGSMLELRPPYQLEEYLLRNPNANFYPPYSSQYILRHPDDPRNSAYLRPGRLKISASDSIEFYRHSSPSLPVMVSAASSLTVKYGYGAPVWHGMMANASKKIHVGPLLGGTPQAYFAGPLWDYGDDSIHFDLFSGSVLKDSGSINMLYNWYYDKTVLNGRFLLNFTAGRYKIRDRWGTARAGMEFTTNLGDPNPPYVHDMRITSDGIVGDELSFGGENQVSFDVDDDAGISLAEIYFRAFGSSSWQKGNLSFSGGKYIAEVPPDSIERYVSLKFRAVDPSGNALEYVAEPAFFLHGPPPPAVPPVPALISPADSATGVPSLSHLMWIPAPRAVGYHLQASTDSGFSTLLLDTYVQKTLEKIGPLGKNKVIFWKVSSQNVSGSSNYSPPRSFTTTADTTFIVPCNLNTPWSLLSIPVQPNALSVSSIFPTAISNAYVFGGLGYSVIDTLMSGSGFWLRLANNDSLGIAGTSLEVDTIPVQAGWNLVGSISAQVSVETVMSDPPGLTTSFFFEYTGSYVRASFITPGKGYWVKIDQPGRLILVAHPTPGALGGAGIHMEATNEMPPPPPMSGGYVHSQSPKMYFLSQNYPNPFNPAAIIQYDVPTSSWITLKVYDMLGREVATLINGMESAGYKQVKFNASSLPTGVYTYRMTAGSFVQTKKMVLIK
jgi:subtilisin family serine protease